MQNVHQKGSDYGTKAVLIPAGTTLLSPHIAIAASVGKSVVKIETPSMALISTGDELVSPEKTPLDWQIRSSNTYALASAIRKAGFPSVTQCHFQDHEMELRVGIQKALEDHDSLILSGGVSEGKFDLVPRVLQACGVKTVFHKVCQKPGKPFWFGVSQTGQPVFGLPGNPVSALVCFYRYILPHLKALKFQTVTLDQEVTLKSQLTHFWPVKVRDGVASLLPWHGSGNFLALGQSDGFVELDGVSAYYPSGTEVPFYSWQI